MTSRFSTKRGRPKSAPNRKTDHGTPELILKRACGETSEAIDLCLQRRIIGADQHRAGMHLRWLYTIRYGAPNISALDMTRGAGMHITVEDDPNWRRAREDDYAQAINLLKNRNRYEPVMQLCVYDERPAFLRRNMTTCAFDDRALHARIEREIDILTDGLDLLVELWKKRH